LPAACCGYFFLAGAFFFAVLFFVVRFFAVRFFAVLFFAVRFFAVLFSVTRFLTDLSFLVALFFAVAITVSSGSHPYFF
jgi:hypothetical protein